MEKDAFSVGNFSSLYICSQILKYCANKLISQTNKQQQNIRDLPSLYGIKKKVAFIGRRKAVEWL